MLHPASSTSEVLTAKLRRATAESHAMIESQLDLFRPGLTTERYAALLKRWLAFYSAWEPAAEKWFASRGDFFPSRSRIAWLKRDLLACGTHADPTPCNLGPVFPFDEPTALGTLYVTEGSTLGGQIISKKITELLNLTPTHGGEFFAAHGPCIGPMWNQTKRLLDEPRSPSEEEKIIGSAINTFNFLAHWLRELNEI